MDNNFRNDVLQICRTCMKDITDASFFYLDCTPAANTQLTIRQKLHSCIPELDLSIVSNAVICSKCVDNILSVYEFKNNCLQSEIEINKYIQQGQHTDDVNLIEVVRFHQPDLKKLDIEIKMEDFKNEDLACDTSAFNKASECTESTEPKYLLMLEKVDTQYVCFNTFDYNINYNLSAAKENPDATHNSNITQNCLLQVIEQQHNYSKNVKKINAYYQCCRCGLKAESKLKLIMHLKLHKQKKFYHKEIVSKTLTRCHKYLFCYYRCSLCKYLTKYKCLFGIHNRIHLMKKDYRHIFKYIDVHAKAFYTTSKVNQTNYKGTNKRKCVKNCIDYDKHSLKNQSKPKKSKQHSSHRNTLKPNMTANVVQKSFKCSICEYQSNGKRNLKRHMLIHTGGKRFSCLVCKYQFSQNGHLKRHMLIHTGEKPFLCSICNCQFRQKSDLKRHIQIHTGEKPFSCSVCEYQCNKKSRLKQHMLIHTGERPFSCSVCDYQFTSKGALNRHMLIHTGEKPFSCSVCDYQCRRKSDLKQHILIHTGEKPFSCYHCEYQCSRKKSLKCHMKIHTGKTINLKIV